MCFFFFKQKTAYEMRISDWSSDVCSSDLHRRFREATGVSPAAFARQRRTARAQKALSLGKPVTDAIYDAGYAAPSRFYAEAEARLGMEPSAWRNGGRGVTIRYGITATKDRKSTRLNSSH